MEPTPARTGAPMHRQPATPDDLRERYGRAHETVTPDGRLVYVAAWSGSVRPYRGCVHAPDGRYLGCTGGCRSPEAAVRAALSIGRAIAEAAES